MFILRHLDDLLGLTRRTLNAALATGRGTDEAPAAVDATAGNGHDTLFLASNIGPAGHVWAFDIQETALASTRERLAVAGKNICNRVTLVFSGHECAVNVLPQSVHGHIWAATFNLGFLPGSDKRLVTQAETTLAALKALALMTAIGGVLSVHSYQGHKGGKKENDVVALWFSSLPWDMWRVTAHTFVNKHRNREILFLAERIG